MLGYGVKKIALWPGLIALVLGLFLATTAVSVGAAGAADKPAVSLVSVNPGLVPELARARQALWRAWQKAGLALARVVLTSEPARGYGRYQPRADGRFRQGGELVVNLYLEPVGYGFRQLPEGWLEYGYTVDLAIQDPEGLPLFSRPGFLEVRRRARQPVLEDWLGLCFSMKGALPGKYLVVVTVRDAVGKGQAVAKVPIEIIK